MKSRVGKWFFGCPAIAFCFLLFRGLQPVEAADNISYVSGGLFASETFDACAVAGDVLYVGAGTSLKSYSLADPLHPKLMGSLSLYERLLRNRGNRMTFVQASKVVPDGDDVYVAFDSLVRIDVHDPAAPKLGEFPGSGDIPRITAFGLKLATRVGERWYQYYGGSLGLYGEDKNGKQTSSTHLAGDPLPYQVSMAAVGSMLFVGNSSARTISIYSLKDPDAPALVGSVPAGEVRALAATPRYLYAADRFDVGTGRLWIFDIADPVKPVLVSKSGSGAKSIALHGTQLYACRDTSLIVYDVSSPASPKLAGSLATPGLSNAMAAEGNTLYVSIGSEVRAIDVSDPAAPRPIAQVVTPVSGILSTGAPLAVANGFAYLKGISVDGLAAMDMRSPASPSVTWTTHPEGEGPLLAAGGRLVNFHGGSVSIYSLASSDKPQLEWAGSVAPVDRFVAAQLQDGILYCEGAKGSSYSLLIMQIVAGKAPRKIASLDLGQHVSTRVGFGDLRLQNGFAYVLCNTDGFLVVDVRKPEAPSIVDRHLGKDLSMLNGSMPVALAVDGNSLFLGSGYGPLVRYQLVDGLPQGAPDRYAVTIGIQGMLSASPYLYFLSADSGLLTYRTGASFPAIYVGADMGLFCSTDGGASWAGFTGASAPPPGVKCIAVSGATVCAGTQRGLAISKDAGATWKLCTDASGLPDLTVWSVCLSGSTIYAGTTRGLAVSSDDGTTWKMPALPDAIANGPVFDVSVDQGTLYVAGVGGIAISRDAGVSWTVRAQADGLGMLPVIKVLARGSVVYAATPGGLSISTDSGTKFATYTAAQGLATNVVWAISTRGTTVYVATLGGLSISPDGGRNWRTSARAEGLLNLTLTGVQATDNALYVATYGGGIGVSTDNGATWTDYTVLNGLPTDFVQCVAASR
jgi:hypothetical protein